MEAHLQRKVRTVVDFYHLDGNKWLKSDLYSALKKILRASNASLCLTSVIVRDLIFFSLVNASKLKPLH